ncbi:MAG: FAD-binding oxidoreductase, partial [Pirellulales bacterium]
MTDRSPIDLDRLAHLLRQELAGEVRFDRYSRALYSTDASLYQIEPIGVVLPRSRRDVELTIRIAADHGVPLLPRGGGTSLSGQSVGAAIVIDFSKYMNRVLEIDAERHRARVEPGVVLDQLNAEAARFGLQFGPDVATSDRANLGGMIGNNSAGARSIRHGKTVDHVRQLDALLADGTPLAAGPVDAEALEAKKRIPGREGELYRDVEGIVATHRDEIVARYPTVLRRVSGYNLDEFVPACKMGRYLPPSVRRLDERFPERGWFNLARLIVGAEGTLATVTEAEVYLVARPAERGLLVLEFDSLPHALDAVGATLACDPSAVELMDRMVLDLAERSLHYRRRLDFLAGGPEALLFVELSGDRRE